MTRRAVLRLRVAPNAKRNEVAGPYGDAIKVKIAAPAVDGKANAALLKYLAGRLGVEVRSLELTSGEKSRDKSVAITGLDSEAARRLLLA